MGWMRERAKNLQKRYTKKISSHEIMLIRHIKDNVISVDISFQVTLWDIFHCCYCIGLAYLGSSAWTYWQMFGPSVRRSETYRTSSSIIFISIRLYSVELRRFSNFTDNSAEIVKGSSPIALLFAKTLSAWESTCSLSKSINYRNWSRSINWKLRNVAERCIVMSNLLILNDSFCFR